ncbi:hypothetical protein PFISCL1PPCAC_12106, partial [Pristionchus fissidentatus]
LRANEKIRHERKRVVVDKYFTIRGRLYTIDAQVESGVPRSLLGIYEIGNDLKMKEVEVHYSKTRPSFNMMSSFNTPVFVYNDDVFLWEFDHADEYDDFDERTDASYLHRGILESEGFHWSIVDTTGEIPNDFPMFGVYDSQESQFYLDGNNNNALHRLDMKTMHWQKIETIVDEETAHELNGIDSTTAGYVIAARKLHVFWQEHLMLDLDSNQWSIVRHTSVKSDNLWTPFNIAGQVFIIDRAEDNTLYRYDADTKEMIHRIVLPDKFNTLNTIYATVSGSRAFLLGGEETERGCQLLLERICVLEMNPSLSDLAASSLMKCKNGKKAMRTLLPKHISAQYVPLRTRRTRVKPKKNNEFDL